MIPGKLLNWAFKRPRHKMVHIYIDAHQNLIFIPTGSSKRWGLVTIESVTELRPPYSDEQIERELLDALDRCYSLPVNEDLESPGALENYLELKSYSSACRGKRLVLLDWDGRDGYGMTPTDKRKGGGYVHMDTLMFSIGKDSERHALAKALRNAIEKSAAFDAPQQQSPVERAAPILTPFGYKMAWLAIRNASREDVISALGLVDDSEAGWDEGIDAVYCGETDEVIFVTPAIDGWTLAIGRWAFDAGENDRAQSIHQLVIDLSARFGEIQAFAAHHVVEYHHWMSARNGKSLRAFAYLGEAGEVLMNSGKMTPAERSFPWDQLDDCAWTPDEETVLEVARAWSIDPTNIPASSVVGSGSLARIPVKRREN